MNDDELRSEMAVAIADVDRRAASWPAVLDIALYQNMPWYDLPFLLHPAFPSLRYTDIRPIVAFGRLLANSIIIHDHLVDRDPEADDAAVTSLRIMAMQFEAYRTLQPLFSPTARFWDRLQRYLSEYAYTCIEERSFRIRERPWSEYTEARALKVAAGKIGVSRAIAAALCELGGDDERLPSLELALDHFNTACQLWDDLNDWKQDLEHGVPSLLLVRVLPDGPGGRNATELRELAEKLRVQVHYAGHSTYMLRLMIRSLDRAAELTQDLPFVSRILTLRHKYTRTLEDIERMMGEQISRATDSRSQA